MKEEVQKSHPYWRLWGWLCLFVPAVFLFYPLLFLNFSTRIPFGGHGDVRNILSIVNYIVRCHLPLSQWFNLPFCYPHANLLAGTHPLIGVSLFFKPLLGMGLSLTQANNLYILLSLLLGAWGSFLLTREITGNAPLSFMVGLFYFIAPTVTTHFKWLNFLSGFYLPFIILLFLRFFYRKRLIYLCLAAILTVLQFLSCVYYGVHLIVLILPALVTAALVLKIIRFRSLGPIIAIGALGGLLILGAMHPSLSGRQWDPGSPPGVDSLSHVSDLFSFGRLADLMQSPDLTRDQVLALSPSQFPGFAFWGFLVLWVTRFRKKKRWLVVTALMTLVLAITLCNLQGMFLLGEGLFILLASGAAAVAVADWCRFPGREKLLFLTALTFGAAMVGFVYFPLIKGFSLYPLIMRWLPVHGLRAVFRVFPYIFPLLIPLAGRGLQTLWPDANENSGRRKRLIPALALVGVMLVENFPLRMWHPRSFKSLERKELKLKYRRFSLPEGSVLLEIPFYAGLKVTCNSDYTLAWDLHRACLVNGKLRPGGRVASRKDIHVLGRLFSRGMVSENTLRYLVQRYSVTHILFNWKRIERVPPAQLERIREGVTAISRYGMILSHNHCRTLMRVQERFPITVLRRTFSSYHVIRGELELSFARPYHGRIQVYGAAGHLRTLECRGKRCRVDLRGGGPLQDQGNPFQFRFEKAVTLVDCRILPRSTGG